jgi:hypothetical protein
VQVLGERLGQPVGQGFHQDGVVVVVLGLESQHALGRTETSGDREGADVVGQPTVSGSDEVTQRSGSVPLGGVRLVGAR